MKFLVAFCLVVLLSSCGGSNVKQPLEQKAQDTTNFTTIHWTDSLVDIGNVVAGKTALIKFRFENTGDKPLYIIKAKPGCGCTVADYPKEPIMPGKQSAVTATYNVAKNGEGDFRKHIQVTTNTKGSTITYLSFFGTIKTDSTATSN